MAISLGLAFILFWQFKFVQLDITCHVVDQYLHLSVPIDDGEDYSNATFAMLQLRYEGRPTPWSNYTTCTLKHHNKTLFTLDCRILDIYANHPNDFYEVRRVITDSRNRTRTHLVTKSYELYAYICFTDHAIKNLTATSTSNSTNITWYTNSWDDRLYLILKTQIVAITKSITQKSIHSSKFHTCKSGCSFLIEELRECTNYSVCVINNMHIDHQSSCVFTKTQCISYPNKKQQQPVVLIISVVSAFLFLLLVVIGIICCAQRKSRQRKKAKPDVDRVSISSSMLGNNKTEGEESDYYTHIRAPIFVSHEQNVHI